MTFAATTTQRDEVARLCAVGRLVLAEVSCEPDVATLLRIALGDLAESAARARTASDARRAARQWSHCAAAEGAIRVATEEAHRRRRIDEGSLRTLDALALRVRDQRRAAVARLVNLHHSTTTGESA